MGSLEDGYGWDDLLTIDSSSLRPGAILFSPVGNNDPISNKHDASMLHICRHHKPALVVLYLSREMLEMQKRDRRYTRAIDMLAGRLGCEIAHAVIPNPSLSDVHEFDQFYAIFKPYIMALAELFPNREILLNISSGTPGMKTALYLLATLLPLNLTPIQVATPLRRSVSVPSFDLSEAWAANEDNAIAAESRCEYVKYDKLNVELQKENIRLLLDKYNYAAALDLATTIRSDIPSEIYRLFTAAKCRSELNWKQIPDDIRLFFGIRTDAKDEDRTRLEEYCNWFLNLAKRGDWGNFGRGLTPLVLYLHRWVDEELLKRNVWETYVNPQAPHRLTRISLNKDPSGRRLLNMLDEIGRAHV